MSVLGCYLDYSGHQDMAVVDKQFELYYANVNLTYAEVPSYIFARKWRTNRFAASCYHCRKPSYVHSTPLAARLLIDC